MGGKGKKRKGGGIIGKEGALEDRAHEKSKPRIYNLNRLQILLGLGKEGPRGAI